eukprot:1159201-Pelagomonas_calceolata.AAC.5
MLQQGGYELQVRQRRCTQLSQHTGVAGTGVIDTQISMLERQCQGFECRPCCRRVGACGACGTRCSTDSAEVAKHRQR